LRRGGRTWQLTIAEAGAPKVEIEAPNVVLATGRNRPPRFSRRPVPDEIAITFKVSVDGARNVLDGSMLVERLPNGWWYLLPCPNGTFYAGVVLRQPAVKHRGAPLTAVAEEAIRDSGLHEIGSIRRISSCQSRPAGSDASPVATGPGWMAVGDAAFAVDALSGQGIEFAIESALRAAQTLGRDQGRRDYRHWVLAYADHSAAIGWDLRN
jgi:flavin-dependent dehydrogenase